MKNTVSEIKNTLEGMNSRLDEAEDRISDLENKIRHPSRATTTKKNLRDSKMATEYVGSVPTRPQPLTRFKDKSQSNQLE